MSKPLFRGASLVVLGCGLLFLAGSAETAAGGKKAGNKKFEEGKDHLKGKARWEWIILDGKKKAGERGTFMGYMNGQIRHGQKQVLVGTWEQVERDVVKANFVAGPLSGGTVVLHLTKASPPAWEGDLDRAGATTLMRVFIIND